jgi:hypothetical protein
LALAVRIYVANEPTESVLAILRVGPSDSRASMIGMKSVKSLIVRDLDRVRRSNERTNYTGRRFSESDDSGRPPSNRS